MNITPTFLLLPYNSIFIIQCLPDWINPTVPRRVTTFPSFCLPRISDQQRSITKSAKSLSEMMKPRGCSFKPTIYNGKRPESAPRNMAWHDRLYQNRHYCTPSTVRASIAMATRGSRGGRRAGGRSNRRPKRTASVPRVASLRLRNAIPEKTRTLLHYHPVQCSETTLPEMLIVKPLRARRKLPRYFIKQY